MPHYFLEIKKERNFLSLLSFPIQNHYASIKFPHLMGKAGGGVYFLCSFVICDFYLC